MVSVLRRCGFVLAMLVVGSLIGCGSNKPASERILGNWSGTVSVDEDALKKFMKDRAIPEEKLPEIKKEMEAGKFYFAFEKDGTGKAGMGEDDHAHIDNMNWKLESEEGNHAVITLLDEAEDSGKLDITFQDDGTMVAKIVPPEKDKDNMPQMTVTLKKVEKLPEDAHGGKPEEHGKPEAMKPELGKPEGLGNPEAEKE